MNVILKDFQPINTWNADLNGAKWTGTDIPAYLIDMTTGRRYWNESKKVVRFKCFLLSLGTLIHPLASLKNIAIRIYRLVTFAHFREHKFSECTYKYDGSDEEADIKSLFGANKYDVSNEEADIISLCGGNISVKHKYNFTARLLDAGTDLLRIVAVPISLVGLELAALYGILSPYDGRKLYASIERLTYEKYILAPCFQPDPQSHLFGGDRNKQNAF